MKANVPASWKNPKSVVNPAFTYVTENKIIGQLLDSKGNVISQVLEREPIGYRVRK